MKAMADLLYRLFEHHLYNALVEDETTDDFLTHVVNDYLEHSEIQTRVSPGHRDDIKEDLREEVLEMLRKKTYGHYSLTEFRKTHTEKAPLKKSHSTSSGRGGRKES